MHAARGPKTVRSPTTHFRLACPTTCSCKVTIGFDGATITRSVAVGIFTNGEIAFRSG